jgi:hypothetical protein
MVRPARVGEISEVVYDGKRWKLLKEFRKTALAIMGAVSGLGSEPIVHGSVARGDVDEKSDVDVFIPDLVPSYRVELALQNSGLGVWKREVVMATPWQMPKAHVYPDEKSSVTFPLVKPKRLELEFYHFGGAVGLEDLKKETRVPGVDKRLMLVEPTEDGHVGRQVVGREAETAKLLGVSIDIVRERTQVLTRRVKVGHTGIFVKRALAQDENIEAVFEGLVEQNPAMNVRLKKK